MRSPSVIPSAQKLPGPSILKNSSKTDLITLQQVWHDVHFTSDDDTSIESCWRYNMPNIKLILTWISIFIISTNIFCQSRLMQIIFYYLIRFTRSIKFWIFINSSFIKNCITFIGHDFYDRLHSRNEGNDIFFNYIVYLIFVKKSFILSWQIKIAILCIVKEHLSSNILILAELK